LQEIHTLFRNFVSEHRPKLDIDAVATGEHWYGVQALELNLVDEIKTSDELLVNAAEHYEVYQIEMHIKQPLQDRLFGGLFAAFGAARNRMATEQNESGFH
jgi:serine protease SohB